MTPQERMASDFRKAAAIIRDKGLSRGAFCDYRTGAHCAAGAVIDAVTGHQGGQGTYMRRYPSARHHLGLLARQLGWPAKDVWDTELGFIAGWNDGENQTADTVAAKLEEVANQLEAATPTAVTS